MMAKQAEGIKFHILFSRRTTKSINHVPNFLCNGAGFQFSHLCVPHPKIKLTTNVNLQK